MLKLLSFIPLEVRAGLAVGAVLLLIAEQFALYDWGHADGYRQAELIWTVKYQQRETELQHQLFTEVDRQASASDAAKADEEAQLEIYRKKLLEMADLAQQLATEAAADKNANNVALDADAVERHNRRLQ